MRYREFKLTHNKDDSITLQGVAEGWMSDDEPVSWEQGGTRTPTGALGAKGQFEKSVTDAIQKVVPIAQEIWFHGSRATGKHRRNSDTDILVVIPDDIVGDQYIAVVRTLQKLSSLFHNYDIQPARSGTNIHRIAQEEGKLLWSNRQSVAEGWMSDDEPVSWEQGGTRTPTGALGAKGQFELSPSSIDALNQYLDDEISWSELNRKYPRAVLQAMEKFNIDGGMASQSLEFQFYDRLVQARDEGELEPSSVMENASVGATASTAVATSVGGGAGFGRSIFMKRMPKEKKGVNRRG